MGVLYSDDNLDLVMVGVYMFPNLNQVDVVVRQIGNPSDGYYYNETLAKFEKCYEPCWFEPKTLLGGPRSVGYLYGDLEVVSDFRNGYKYTYMNNHNESQSGELAKTEDLIDGTISMSFAIPSTDYTQEHFQTMYDTILTQMYAELEYAVNTNWITQETMDIVYENLHNKLNTTNFDIKLKTPNELKDESIELAKLFSKN